MGHRRADRIAFELSRRTTLIAMAAAAGVAGRAGGQEPADFVGEWGGVLDAGSMRLRLRLVIEEAAGGALTSTVYSLDQQNAEIRGDDARIDGDRFRDSFPDVRGSLDVRLVSGALEGEWRQGGVLEIRFVRNPDFETLGEAQPTPMLTPEYLDTLRSRAGSPALAAAARGRDAAVAAVAGVRIVDGDEPATENDLWHIGSITKSFTALLAATFVEAGELSWDTTVGSVFEEIAPEMNDAYRDATLAHLLSHRGGLRANVSRRRLASYPIEEGDPRETRRAYVAEALNQQPSGRLGESYTYSNSGFVLAGAMMEAVANAPWEDLLRRRVLDPLGLSTAGYGAPRGENAPAGHTAGLLGAIGLSSRRRAYVAGEAARTDNPAVLGPAGRLHLSLTDLLTYLEAHRDRGLLVEPATWDHLHTPPFGGSYAMGLIVRSNGDLWHNGSNTLWYAEVLISRARGVVAAAAANDGALVSSSLAVGRALAAAADTAAL